MLIATGASGWGVMSCALGAWCRNHKVKRGKNQLTMYILTISCPRVHVVCSTGQVSKPQGEPGSKPLCNIILFPSFLMFLVCLQSCLKARSFSKPIKQYNCQKGTRGGDERRERGCSQLHLCFACVPICLCIVGAQPYMCWHACEILWIWREWKCHRPNPRFSSVFWCFFR